jgi:3-oxoacyl-[acyl-carrier protein] reductase
VNLGIQNKVVVIVGASRGIGAAVARVFAQEGARLALISRGRDDLERLAGELRSAHPAVEVMTFSRDATEPGCAEAVIKDVVAWANRVDVLVNNAGAGLRRPFENLSDSDWVSSLDLNLMSAIRFSRAVVREMKRQGGGRIINVAAVSATRPRLGQIASNVGKAALVNLTRSLAMEMGPHNILVNAVSPGSVDSPRWRARLEAEAKERKQSAEELMRNTVGRVVPMGRVGTPDEVAGMVVFLTGDQASYITGTVIDVDGGMGAGILLE